jgi:hypothetical protein
VTDGFTITVPGGPLVCGYCGEEDRFGSTSAAGILDGERQINPAAELAKGTIGLTGCHALGVGPDGELVVLAEIDAPGGAPAGWLVHLCQQIPSDVYKKYATDIAGILGR